MKITAKITALVAAGLLALSLTAPVSASERPEHFEGKPAETLDQALANFSEYHDKLAQVLAQDSLSAEDLQKVHKLTYTLENALEKMRDELDDLADTLEAVHLASESADIETVRESGKAYLDTSRKIVE